MSPLELPSHRLLARRGFLSRAAFAPFIALHSSRAAPASQRYGEGLRAGEGPRFEPEYARGLSELLIVYDQVAPDYLFGEVMDIVACLKPGGRIFFLASRPREEEARRRLEEHGVRARVLVCDSSELWGDWGRDIFHVGWRDGATVLLVPYTKTARTRGELTRGYEIMRSLLAEDRNVRLVPLSFEGGNLAYDRSGGERILFAGNSVIVESRELYRRWFGRALEARDCIELLRRSFGVDRVVTLGRVLDGELIRQANFFFHIDLACAIVGEGAVAVERFELPVQASIPSVREEVRIEVEGSARDAAERLRIEELLARKGKAVKLPSEPKDVESAVEEGFQAEMKRLEEAHEELEAIRRAFAGLGYRILDLPTDWRRVRRTQSYANVLISRDRLIMPIFPAPDAGRARVVLLPAGRQIVEILRHPQPDEYRLDGFNRANYEVYRSIFGDVRVVRDAFYLAGGNVHCVVGAIG